MDLLWQYAAKYPPQCGESFEQRLGFSEGSLQPLDLCLKGGLISRNRLRELTLYIVLNAASREGPENEYDEHNAADKMPRPQSVVVRPPA
jgi:hypothetical protein